MRNAPELEVESVPGAVHIPLPQLRARLGELPRDKEIHVICRSAVRAYYATRILLQNGFRAKNISGGMLARSHTGDRLMGATTRTSPGPRAWRVAPSPAASPSSSRPRRIPRAPRTRRLTAAGRALDGRRREQPPREDPGVQPPRLLHPDDVRGPRTRPPNTFWLRYAQPFGKWLVPGLAARCRGCRRVTATTDVRPRRLQRLRRLPVRHGKPGSELRRGTADHRPHGHGGRDRHREVAGRPRRRLLQRDVEGGASGVGSSPGRRTSPATPTGPGRTSSPSSPSTSSSSARGCT